LFDHFSGGVHTKGPKLFDFGSIFQEDFFGGIEDECAYSLIRISYNKIIVRKSSSAIQPFLAGQSLLRTSNYETYKELSRFWMFLSHLVMKIGGEIH